MKQSDLIGFLIFEAGAFLLALGSFQLFTSELVAAVTAGGGFLLLGAWIVGRSWAWPDKWRSFVFWTGHVHLWLVALPMLLFRLAQSSDSFAEVQIWGLPGPVFHRLSEFVFVLLVGATIVDLARVRLAKRLRNN